MTPADQRDIPNHMVPCSAVKQGMGEVVQSCYFSISWDLAGQQLVAGEQLGFCLHILLFSVCFVFSLLFFCCVTGISLGGEWGVEGLCAMICKLVCLFVCFLTIIPSLS